MTDDQEFQEIVAILGKCDEPLMADFLRDLLTPSEIRELCQRWRIVKLLADGVPQRQISSELKSSLCKITRGSRELKKPDSPFARALKLRDASGEGQSPA